MEAFPDLTISAEGQILEGHKAVSRFTAGGTHQGGFLESLGVVGVSR